MTYIRLVAQIYVLFSVLPSIYHPNVLQKTLHSVRDISRLQEIQKNDIKDFILVSLNKVHGKLDYSEQGQTFYIKYFVNTAFYIIIYLFQLPYVIVSYFLAVKRQGGSDLTCLFRRPPAKRC